MKKPGFPPSTIALIVLMLGALYMVSKTVTPPPKTPPVTPASATETANPGHGEPGHVHGADEDHGKPAETAKPDPKKEKEEMERTRKMYEAKMNEESKKRAEQAKIEEEAKKRISVIKEPGQKPIKFDPTSTTIDSKLFDEMPMGEQGIEETDKLVAQAEVAKAKLRQTEAAIKAEMAAKKNKSEKPKQAAP